MGEINYLKMLKYLKIPHLHIILKVLKGTGKQLCNVVFQI